MDVFFAGNGIWAVIWCVCNVVVFLLVILAMKKSNKMFIIPALIVSIFDIIVGIIQAIVAFASLWIISWVSICLQNTDSFFLYIFRAIIILIISGITAYYALGLKTVYDDISSAGPAAAEPSADSKPQIVNPV